MGINYKCVVSFLNIFTLFRFSIQTNIMHILSIFLTALAAIAMMTLFSYLLSKISDHQFEEPRLLGFLLHNFEQSPQKKTKENVWGWLIHYGIGIFFVFIFALVWTCTIFSPDIVTGGIMGLIAGIAGIIGWKIMFSIKERPPDIAYLKFYWQLLAAHLIFGITAGGLYPILSF